MSQLHVFNGLFIHREKSDGGAVFRRHVGYGGPVGNRQILDSWAEVFHKLFYHMMLSEKFGDHQHQIGGCNTFFQLTLQADTHHLGNRHVIRLPQHYGLRFDASDPPSQHADTVDHGGMRVRADQSIRVSRLDAV